MDKIGKEHPPKHRFRALDSLRGICACMVVLFHCPTQGLIYNSAFIQHSFLFVDFFFVLSGFVIANGYGENIAGGFAIMRFMLLRWGRVYPLHLFMLAVFVAFEIGFALLAPAAADRQPFAGSYDVQSMFANLFLVQIFAGPDQLSWNGPSWSIAAEFWTYLVFALMFRWGWKLLVPVCLIVAVAAALLVGYSTDRYIEAFHDGAFARCMFGFALGVMAQRLYLVRLAKLRGKTSFAGASVLEVLTTVTVIAFVTSTGNGPSSMLGPPVFFLAMVLFALEGGAISRFLLTAPMPQLGMLSYSIYMVHWFLHFRFVNVLAAVGKMLHRPLTTVHGSHQVGGGPIFGDAMSLTLLAVTIAVSAVTYRFIEMPGQLWSRNKFSFRSRPAKLEVESQANAAGL